MDKNDLTIRDLARRIRMTTDAREASLLARQLREKVEAQARRERRERPGPRMRITPE